MISIILYGRNDNYGYNLHKRAALSLNCMAEVLTDPDDEILFVDYNTNDDFPTFPEAIQDTLTQKAREKLRILRVRPSVHARWRSVTHLFTLEPLARNVALRRSNENNRFILSTNTDMIFVPRRGASLTDLVRDLPYGFYGLPRFEIPETLWESVDRKDPKNVIETVGKWGWRFYLNEIVYGTSVNRFDAPGDFQLIERKDLFAIDGFDENMLLGWHVDSNIGKRLGFLHKDVGDLTERCFGYHCDHTRQVTPMHKSTSRTNDLKVFVDDVQAPNLPGQRESWGCANDAIEEISLIRPASQAYIGALEAATTEPLSSLLEIKYNYPVYWDKIDYDPRHVLPFLLDMLVCAPASVRISYFGGHKVMFDLLRGALRRIGLENTLLVTPANAVRLGLAADDPSLATPDQVFAADTLIFDWVTLEGKAVTCNMSPANTALVDDLVRSFHKLVDAERARSRAGSAPPRQVVMINALENRFEVLVRDYIDYARTPFSSRLRHGFIRSSDGLGPLKSLKKRMDRRGLRQWMLRFDSTDSKQLWL
jgi:hypothetical protein